MLGENLQSCDAARLLREAGDPVCDETGCIRELRRRLTDREDFPREIGLFLRCSPEDMQGFIEHRDCSCKCAGCWKVYGDEQAARKKFEQYRQCTCCYLHRNAQGCPLERLSVKTA